MKRIKAVIVFLQIAAFQFFLQGCSSSGPIQVDVRPLSLTESKDKINFNVVFAHTDDLETFSFYYKYIGNEASENLYIDKILYDSESQKERSFRYPGETVYKRYYTGDLLKRNAGAVFKSAFNNATTLHFSGEDHFEGLVLDHQPYKEIVPPDTVGIIKLRSPQVLFFLDCTKPEISFSSCDLGVEFTAEWVLEDLDGNTVWSNKIVGYGAYDYRLLESMETKVCNSFQPAVDDHFRNLADAIETSPEIRLLEALLQIDRNRLLADPSSVHETLNDIQNTQEKRRIANKLVYLAIEKGNVSLLMELLSTTLTNINLADKYYQRLPIHLAVQNNNFAATELLIANGSVIDAADSGGATPLHYAASNGHTRIAGLLIKNGADVNANNSEGQTPFILAVANGYKNDWQLLLDSGAKPDAINEEDALSTAQLYNEIGLHFAEKGDKDKSTEAFWIASDYFEKASIVYNRASKRAATDEFLKDVFKFTMLTAYAWGSRYQAQQQVKWYAEIKALNDAKEMGLTQTQTLDLIHDYKSNMRILAVPTPLPSNTYWRTDQKGIVNYYSDLSEICRNSAVEVESILKCYEEHGAWSNECIPDDVRKSRKASRDSELVEAAKNGDLAAVQYSLSSGTNVNASDKNGTTALNWASTNGHTDVVKLLLENGADVDTRRNSGETALWIASFKGHTESVRLLLQNGANVNLTQTDTGVTPLWIASQEGFSEIVKLLLDNGANVDAKRRTDEVSALYKASQKAHTEVVKLLLDNGADVNVKITINDEEWTALKLAKSKGYSEIVQLLEGAGAE